MTGAGRLLGAVLVAAVSAALFWVTVLPPLQGPDEEGHFAYTQWIVERGAIPWYPRGVSIPNGQKPYSPEVAVAEKQAGLEPLLANLAARPLWTGADRAIWSAADRALPPGSRANGPPSATFRNPPLYYLYAALPYEAARGGSIFDRLYLMRLWNVPLLLAAVWLTWLLAGELGAGATGRLAAAGIVALQPQLLNVTATVGPDVLLVVLWTAGIYVAVRLARQGWSSRLALAGLAVLVACGFTHPRGIALAAPLGVALAIAAVRRFRPQATRRVGWALAGVAAAALVVAVVAAGSGAGSIGQFGSYVWQFYLPKLPFMGAKIGPAHYGFHQAFVDRIWSGFADLEVTQPGWVTGLMLGLTLALLVALVALAVARRDRLRERWYVLAIPALGALALLVVLHVTAYRSMLTVPADPIITGRHVLPLVPTVACGVALLIDALPWSARRMATAIVLAGAVLVQLGAAGELLGRFYA